MRKNVFNIIWKKRLLLVPILVITVSSLLLIVYLNRMSDTATDFTGEYMREMATHDKLNVTDKLQSYRENLLETSMMIRMQKIDSIEEATGLLQLKRESGHLKNLFLIGSDGMTYSYNHVVTDQSEEAFVHSVIDLGEAYLAKPDMSAQWYDWNNTLRYAIPIEPLRLSTHEIVGICGEYSFETLGDSLQLQFFGDQGIATLIDRQGNVLSQTGIVTQQPIEHNFFTELTNDYRMDEKDSVKALLNDLKDMKAVNFQYRLDGEKYLCLSVPIPEMELTLISTVPVSVARLQYTQMLQLTLVTVLIITVIILGLSIGLYKTYWASVQMEIQKNTAEEVAAAKSTFLSNMSHEIRTPLNAIIGFSELLSRDRKLSEQHRDQVKKIESSSHYLLSLINDILDMSRIERSKTELRKEPMELDTLLENIDSIIGGQAKRRGIRYQSGNNCLGLCVNGDSVRLQQILMNLLGNALKFTPPEGEISMNVDYLSEDENTAVVRFMVSDTGCGMSEEFLSKLYTPFTQEYNKNTKKQVGTGLGLSISYKLAQLMNGDIRVESKLNEGSCFTVEIPFEKATCPRRIVSREVPEPEQIDWTGVTILVAEDNELNMEILISLLELYHIKTRRAVNGQEAYDLFRASEQDEVSLILMDMQMPVMDGLEATDRIRASKHPRAKTIPILAVTANAFTSDVEKAIAHGMNDYIAKPIDPKILFSKLIRYLYKGGETL